MAVGKFRIGLVREFPTTPGSVRYIDMRDLDQALRMKRQVNSERRWLPDGSSNPILALIEYYDEEAQGWVYYETCH